MARPCYEKNFLPASFRGFGFEAVNAEYEVGRRGMDGEFPFSEQTADLDMGRKKRSFRLTARFADNNHIQKARAFARVCERKGPGVLVHPTYGIVKARCVSAKFSDELIEGYGVTTVELDFSEAPDQITDLIGSVLGVSIDGFLGNLSSFFIESYLPEIAPFFEQSAIIDMAAGLLAQTASSMTGAINYQAPTNVLVQLSTVQRHGANPSYNYNANGFINALSGGLASIDQYGATTQSRYNSLKAIANFSAQRINVNSPVGVACQSALLATVRMMACAYMARVASQDIADNFDDAIRRVDEIDAILTQEMEIARAICDPELFLELYAFKAQTISALTRMAYDAPARVMYRFVGPVSAQAAAYRIYGDAKRFLEIEAANPYMPCFAMGPDILAKSA